MTNPYDVQYNGFFDDCGKARAVAHYFKIGGHDIQIYVTKKRGKVRVFIDHEEWNG